QAGYSNGLAGCAPSVCIGNCPVWTGAGIRADLRLSEGGAPRWLLAALRLKLCRSCPHKHTCHLAATAAAAANSLAAPQQPCGGCCSELHQSLSRQGLLLLLLLLAPPRPVDGDSSPVSTAGHHGGQRVKMAEKNLIQELLRDYDKKSRPV
uniref:TGFb_propeptide domain-containing protein n=1 Tax=Macrostomum lignano TaxID=282301 RepID=A0A1I8IRF8_9PLAT